MVPFVSLSVVIIMQVHNTKTQGELTKTADCFVSYTACYGAALKSFGKMYFKSAQLHKVESVKCTLISELLEFLLITSNRKQNPC